MSDPKFFEPEQACVTHHTVDGMTGHFITKEEAEAVSVMPLLPLSKVETILAMEKAMAENIVFQVIHDSYGVPRAFPEIPSAAMLYDAFEAFLKAKRLL